MKQDLSAYWKYKTVEFFKHEMNKNEQISS